MADDRGLSYMEYGPKEGFPVLYFHDFPGSHEDIHLFNGPELADHLGIGKFSILGYSGGAPFALSCAFAIPERIEKVVIVSVMGPADAPEAKKGKAMLIPKAPWDFDLSEINQAVIWWHGGLDENVKIETAEFVIQNVPNCSSVIKPEEGYLSLLVHSAEDILATFLEP